MVRATWQKLVDGGHLDFGEGATTKSNLQKLVEQLKKESRDFKRGHHSGMPAGSKKYRWLFNFVTREAKKERGQDLDDEPEHPDADSSVLSFKSVQGLHNCDTASGFFRNDDMPPT